MDKKPPKTSEKALLKRNGEPKKNGKHSGRPSKYKPEFCKLLIDMMTEGEAVANVCAKLDISKETFYKWSEEIVEFNDAFKIAKAKSEAWWTSQGKGGMWGGKDFNAAVFMINMRNRFRWGNYKDTYHPVDIEGYEGTLDDRLNALHKAFRKKKIPADIYATMVSALSKESGILATGDLLFKIDAVMSHLGIEDKE